MPDKSIWNDKSQLFFQTALSSHNSKLQIKYFLETDYSIECVDTAVSDSNSILLQAAEKFLKRKKVFLVNSKNKNNHNESHKNWYDNDLYKMKQE